MQAAVQRVKLKHIKAWSEQRRERAATYNRLFAEAGLSRAPTNVDGRSSVTLPQTSEHAHHVFHQYVIRAQRRDELRAFLAQRDIATGNYYQIPLILQHCSDFLVYVEVDLYVALSVSM